RRVVVGELGEDQPVLAGPLHPGADVGDEGAGRPDPVVEPFQGPENAGEGRPHGASYRTFCRRCGQGCRTARKVCRRRVSRVAWLSSGNFPREGRAMGLPRRGILHLAVSAAAGAATLPLLPERAAAQVWPNRPVRWVVGF